MAEHNLNPAQFGEQLPLFSMPRREASAGNPHRIARSTPTPDYENLSGNKHGAYLRFGDWPEDERSFNHAQGGKEEGVSVYAMGGLHAEPDDPDPHGSRYDFDVQGHREMHIDMHGSDEDFDPDDYGDSIRGNDTGQEMRDRRVRAFRNPERPDMRGHFVTGTLVGFGHDDEPLLHNVKHVGAWPHDAHRFVLGTNRILPGMENLRAQKGPI